MNVRFHQQDTGEYCGEAAVLMLIDSTSKRAALPCQGTIASPMSAYNRGNFATSPEAMIWGLNHFVAPSLKGATFAFNNDVSIDAAMVRIIQALEGRNAVAPVVAYYGGYHWLLVTAVTTAAASTGSGLTTPCLFVNSSSEVHLGATDPPPHVRGDRCGSPGNGIVNEVLSYDFWQRTFTTINDTYSFVTMTVPNPTSGMTFSEPQSPWFSTAGLDAKAAAFGAMHAFSLCTDGPLATAMSNVDAVGAPQIVAQYNMTNLAAKAVGSYANIPLMSKGIVVGFLSLDRLGSYMTTAYAYNGPAGTVDADQARKIVFDYLQQFEDRETAAMLAELTDTPELMWAATTASPFPTRPLYRFPVSADNKDNVFVRTDGALFRRLVPIQATGSHP